MEPAGRDNAALGPGDNSDSGSDTVGLEDRDLDDPVERHPARRGVDALDARDIGVDRVFTPGSADEDVDASGRLRDDEDPDLAFVGSAVADDAVDEEEGDESAEDDDGDGDSRGLGDEGDNIPGAEPTVHPRRPR